MIAQVQAHDLLWGMQIEMLSHDVPQWAIDAVAEQRPVVVRRAMTQKNRIAVGIRGQSRNQRFATQMDVNTIKVKVQPEDLIHTDLNDFPHLQPTLQPVHSLMQALNWPWGYTGSVGFELATNIKTVTATSDIDLLIRATQPMLKSEAQEILTAITALGLQLDVQLQTPSGGVALKEWAKTTGKVLLKRNDAAVLVDNPWY